MTYEEFDITPRPVFIIVFLFLIIVCVPGLIYVQKLDREARDTDAIQRIRYYLNEREVRPPVDLAPRVYNVSIERRITIENPSIVPLPIRVHYEISYPLYTQVVQEIAPTVLQSGSNYFVTYVSIKNSTIPFENYDIRMWVTLEYG